MKTLALLALALVLSCGVASAQDVTGFNSKVGPGVKTQTQKNPPNPRPDLKPKLGGVFVDGVKYGTVMISPTAPASYGIGAKYLAAPNQFQADLQHESCQAAHRPTGGMKLFSFEF